MSAGWLQRQRKADLIEIATSHGISGLERKRKSDVEAELDQFLTRNWEKLSGDPRLAGYYRRLEAMSPVKRENALASEPRPVRRRAARTTLINTSPEAEATPGTTEDEPSTSLADTSTDLASATRTPGRAMALAARISLPATPADVAQAVDRSTMAVRNRVATMYADSKIPHHVGATRQALSTVTSILFCVSAFELYFLRKEILADRYAFTIPTVEFLGTRDYPVNVPDMFLVVTSSFWYPALTWAFTSLLGPCLVGYFFNLSAAASMQIPTARHTRASTSAGTSARPQQQHLVDPVTFSIAKAILSFVVYGQGVTFGGWIPETSVERINRAVYGGWQGVIAGTAITGIASVYDAVLKK